MPKYESQFTGNQIDERLGKIPQMEEDIEYLKENGGGGGGGIITETDPTVPAWAKQPTKPKYTAEEVGALPADTVIPEEVHIGEEAPTDENIKIWIDPNDDEKLPLSAFENDVGYITEDNIPEIPTVPTKISAFENDKGYITADDIPEVPEAPQADWAQNNETAADYIKNRTHYEGWTEFFPETVAEYDEGMECTFYQGEGSKPLEAGKQYNFIINGVENIITAVLSEGTPALMTDDGSMFGVMDDGGGILTVVALFMTTEPVVFKVEEFAIVTLPNKFLPYSAQCYDLVLTEEDWANMENNIITITDRTCDDFIPLLWNGARLRVIRDVTIDSSNIARDKERICDIYYVQYWRYSVNYLVDNSGTECMLMLMFGTDLAIVIGGTWVPPEEQGG